MFRYRVFAPRVRFFRRFSRPSHSFGKTSLRLAAGALAIACFLFDTFTEPDIQIAVLYVVVVLLSERFLDDRGIRAVSLGCIALTILSVPLSPGNRFGATAIANASLGILAIGASTVLILQNRRAKQDLQRAQAELERVGRVATLGELTATLAHEINQPLTGLVSSAAACARWLARDPPNLDAARQSVDRIAADGRRAGEVITRIRSLISGAPPRQEWMNANDRVMDVIRLLEPETRRNRITLQTNLSIDLPLVMADRIGFDQVMLNLIMNAIEAMSGMDEGRELLVSSKKDASGSVLISVQDSGPGLDEVTAGRLFDAFYTTKPAGMGMGLAISRRIVEAHGGRIWATRNVPRGATVHFTFPGAKTPGAGEAVHL